MISFLLEVLAICDIVIKKRTYLTKKNLEKYTFCKKTNYLWTKAFIINILFY